MKRIELTPRNDWQLRVERLGLVWHSENGRETWNERAAYLLSSAEVEKLYRAASKLAEIYHQAASHIVKNKLWSLLGLPEHEAEIIASSWEKREWSLHGRFDFLFDTQGCPKLLEYNAETALSLVETAVIQKTVACRNDAGICTMQRTRRLPFTSLAQFKIGTRPLRLEAAARRSRRHDTIHG